VLNVTQISASDTVTISVSETSGVGVFGQISKIASDALSVGVSEVSSTLQVDIGQSEKSFAFRATSDKILGERVTDGTSFGQDSSAPGVIFGSRSTRVI
jgi:hypothetical protein